MGRYKATFKLEVVKGFLGGEGRAKLLARRDQCPSRKSALGEGAVGLDRQDLMAPAPVKGGGICTDHVPSAAKSQSM